MSDRRLKPCANCGHGKTLHRVGSCRHATETITRTYFGAAKFVEYCQCSGYQPTPTRQQATRKDR